MLIPHVRPVGSRKRFADRMALGFCAATLLVAAGCAVLGFSPGWIALPVAGAIGCSLLRPVSGILEMIWGGRDRS